MTEDTEHGVNKPASTGSTSHRLSGRTDCYGWAFGLAKYLAFRDPLGCVRWTLDFVKPHVQTTGEYADAVHRSIGFLEGVLTGPNRASLQEMDEFAWLPWSHRWAIKGAGPLARLIWAAMGAVLFAQPNEPTKSELPSLFHADDGPRTVAEKMVWDQCATAIHILGHDNPAIPSEVAAAFTKRACHTTPPAIGTIMRRLEWAWESLVFEVAVVKDTEDAFHLQYNDCQGEEPLFSGPFSTMTEIDDRLDLLKHGPITIRLERIL